MAYFKLYPDVKYIEGKSRATLYLLGVPKTIHLSKKESGFIRDLLKEDINNLIKKYGDDINKTINYLLENGIGMLYEKENFTEGYIPYVPIEIKGLLEPKLSIETLFIQLSDKCNINCDFCANDEYFVYQGCNSCLRWKNKKEDIYIKREKILEEIESLNGIEIKTVMFSGGNPFLLENLLIECIQKFDIDTEICIACPDNYIDLEILNRLKRHNIILVLNLICDIENKKGLKERLDNTIKILNLNGIKYSFNCIIPFENRVNYNEIIKILSLYEPQRITSTELIPINYKNHKISSLPVGQERIENIDTNRYFYISKNNGCMNKKISIASNGDILICPSIKKSIGNINEKNGLRNVFQKGENEYFWRYTKKLVNKCNECENRFACVDCSGFEMELKKNPGLLNNICEYDVENGIWINEIEREDFNWKL